MRRIILLAAALACFAIFALNLYVVAAPSAGTQATPAEVLSAFERALGIPTFFAQSPLVANTAEALPVPPALVALLSIYAGESATLAAPAQSSGCAARGPLPDPTCTPGAVFAVGTSTICTPGYSASVRSVSVTQKRAGYAAYGLSYPQAAGTYEYDHLIPLELGGSNSQANLFPEAATPAPGFHEKDLVENYLHAEVCAGQISLPAAQMQIARDWLAVYNTLSPDILAALKRQVAQYKK